MNKLVAGIVAGCAIAFAGQTLAQETLTVWWVKGFYKSEDDALFAAIKKFEDKTKVKVELSQYPVQDMIPKTVAALDAGTGSRFTRLASASISLTIVIPRAIVFVVPPLSWIVKLRSRAPSLSPLDSSTPAI